MPTKKKRKKLSTRKMQKGTVGNFFVFGVLGLLVVLGITAVGGFPTSQGPVNGTSVNVITPTQGATHNTLQLQTFGYVTVAPTPTSAPPAASPLCQAGGANDEPGIIAATSPVSGQSVSATGQVKVWVFDEGAPMIAQGETTNADGSIATPGNTSGLANDNYLFEPAVYLDSATAESGGHPYFPNYVKGQYNNNPSDTSGGFAVHNVTTGAAIDAVPANASTAGCINSNFFPNCYKAEYIWNVSSLGLSAGNHQAEFVIHDGDSNRGVGCVNIQIQ